MRKLFTEYVPCSELWSRMLPFDSSSKVAVVVPCVMCHVNVLLEILLPWDVARWTSVADTDVRLLVCCRV